MSRQAQATLRAHGKSFYWAARFLPTQQAQRAARLYAFCRGVDDIADHCPSDLAQRRLSALRRALRWGEEQALTASDRALLAELRQLMAEVALPTKVVDDLLVALMGDLKPVAFTTHAELLRYAYGVASTVGIAMCSVLGLADRRALPFAVDLGIAMQLTNIARDVREDAARQRRYLPAPELTIAGIQSGAQRQAVDARVDELLQLAERYYRSADRGMHFIPWRARLAIMIAARIYEAIGPKIQRQRGRYWRQRIATSRVEKSWHALRALVALCCRPCYWRRSLPPPHDPTLHRPLAADNLLGIDAPHDADHDGRYA